MTETAFFSGAAAGGAAGAAADIAGSTVGDVVAEASGNACSAAGACADESPAVARSCCGTGGMMPPSFGSSPAKPEKPAALMCALPRQCSTNEMCPETVVPQAAHLYCDWKNLSVCAGDCTMPSTAAAASSPAGAESMAWAAAILEKNSSESGGTTPDLFGVHPAKPRCPTRRKCSMPMQCCRRLVSPLHSFLQGAQTNMLSACFASAAFFAGFFLPWLPMSARKKVLAAGTRRCESMPGTKANLLCQAGTPRVRLSVSIRFAPVCGLWEGTIQ